MKTSKVHKFRIMLHGMKELGRIARRLHRLDENDCNYGLSAKQEAQVVRLEKEAEKLAKEYFGLHVYHQSDPRGASLYLVETLKDVHSRYTDGMAI